MRVRTSRRARARVGLLAAGLLAPALTGCGQATAPTSAAAGSPAGPGVRVVATTTQVADFTRNVVGSASGRVHLTQLLKPNIDPHDYEPSPADVQALAGADVLVVNGVALESGWLDLAVQASGFHGRRIDASRGIAVRTGNGTDEQAIGDPHIWHDPTNARTMVADITAGLALADPVDAPTFRANAAGYDARLVALDAGIRAELATLPAADRKLVTNHDAFGYYVAHYGLEFVGSVIPSFDTSAALSGSQINALVAKIRRTGTRAIFSESSLPPNAARALAKQAGVTVEAGEGSLYGDTLGPAGSAGATYLQMEQHNTDTIVAALRA